MTVLQERGPTESFENRPDEKGTIGDLSYRYILDLLPCCVSIQSPSLHILFSNKRFEKNFGDGIGRLCHEVYKRANEKCESCPVEKTFEDKKAHTSEETVRLSTGETAQMVVYSAPILDVLGNVTAVIELSSDITIIKETEKGVKALGQSMAMVSHEIKNILEGLHGGAYVVDTGIKEDDLALARKGWKIVKKNITEISNMTQNILYSAKKDVLKNQRVFPKEIVDRAAGLLLDKASAMGIELEIQTNPALPSVSLDPSSISRMLTNLIWNSIEACSNDGESKLHTVVVRAEFYDKTHFMFEVEDNGVGMDDATLNKIFEEFFTTKGGSGTGLGLSVVDKIVKAHEGRLEVLSATGKGSTFRVIFEIR